jgi:phosphoribosylformylglycinamidine synthase
VDGNATYVFLDPYEGGKCAVVEAARNLACAGAIPLAVTDNLNYANPHNPEIFWQLRESVRGLADACHALDTPVTGGNVSLYNQRGALGAIDPTPTVAMVGLVEKGEHVTTQWFKDEGDIIVLLGEPVDRTDPLQGLGGSAYLQVIHGKKTGLPPRCPLQAARILHTTLVGLIRAGGVKSAHDCSEGGLLVAVAECCLSRADGRHAPVLKGAIVDLAVFNAEGEPIVAAEAEGSDSAPAIEPMAAATSAPIRRDALLFGETQSRVIITCSELDATKVIERARLMGVPALAIGVVGGDQLVLRTPERELAIPVSELHDRWWNAIARAME